MSPIAKTPGTGLERRRGPGERPCERTSSPQVRAGEHEPPVVACHRIGSHPMGLVRPRARRAPRPALGAPPPVVRSARTSLQPALAGPPPPPSRRTRRCWRPPRSRRSGIATCSAPGTRRGRARSPAVRGGTGGSPPGRPSCRRPPRRRARPPGPSPPPPRRRRRPPSRSAPRAPGCRAAGRRRPWRGRPRVRSPPRPPSSATATPPSAGRSEATSRIIRRIARRRPRPAGRPRWASSAPLTPRAKPR